MFDGIAERAVLFFYPKGAAFGNRGFFVTPK